MSTHTSKTLHIHGMRVSLTRKRVKNLNLRVVPPSGEVRVSAPRHVSERDIVEFVGSRKAWILDVQQRILTRETPRRHSLSPGDTVPVWGSSLCIQFQRGQYAAYRDGESLLCRAPDYNHEALQALYDQHLREQMKARIPALLSEWEARIGVKTQDWGVKKMKTKWGSCNISAARIWLNLELAKYPEACLEYVLVHELVHLLERYHNARFYAFMDQYLPGWRQTKAVLDTPLET